MIRIAALALCLGLAPGLSAAQSGPADVLACDWQASAAALVEPWSDNSRTFSNGATRIALLDTIEPAAGAFWLLVLSPPHSELGDRQCRVVGYSGMGFAGLDFQSLSAVYDPAVGLSFALPAQVFGGAGYAWGTLNIVLNQATGAIEARFDP